MKWLACPICLYQITNRVFVIIYAWSLYGFLKENIHLTNTISCKHNFLDLHFHTNGVYEIHIPILVLIPFLG